MLIRRVQLENYKIFYGKNALDLSKGPDNVVVIQGDNGHGKTTIMESIFWALYGKEKRHDKLRAPKLLRLINNRAKKENDYYCSVALNFDHDGKHYFLERSIQNKRKTKAPSKNRDFHREVKFRVNGREEEDYETVLTEIFPKDIATFFFFDGETISKYAGAYTSNKKTVEKALGLPYLKRAQDDAKDVKKGLEKTLKGVKVSTKTDKLEKEIEAHDKKREDKTRMLNITEKILNNLNSERRKLRRVLEEFEELKTIHERIQDLEEFDSELDKEEEELREKEAELNRAIPTLIVGGLMRDSIERIEELKEQSVNDRIDQGRIMDQKEFLSHLLDTGICVCGQEFTEDSLGHIRAMVENLTERLSQIDPVETDRYGWSQGEIAEALLRVKTLEKEMVNIPKLEAKHDYIEENRQRIQKALERETKRLEQHSAQNKREKAVFDRLNKVTKDRAVYMNKRMTIKDELEAIERHQLDLEVQLRKELERQNLETLKISRQLDLIDRVLNTFHDIIERSAEMKRKKMEKKGSTIFHEITNKPKEFVGLDIDEDTFEVKVRSSDGALVNTKRLSDGEKHVVALSFMGGIKESTSEGTLIMDSPFGRLDQTHKSRLIKRIGDLAQQVVLLVTDEDIEPDQMHSIGNLQRLYNLEHDQTQKISKIVMKQPSGGSKVKDKGPDPHITGLMDMMAPESMEWDTDGGPTGGV